MRNQYVKFVCREINKVKIGDPIYTKNISKKLSDCKGLDLKAASAAVSVAINRIEERKLIPDFCFYKKGIYYRTALTPFGEIEINKECLISDKYLKENGYETGPSLMHRIGLTTQIPRERTIATNIAAKYGHSDKELDIKICHPKTKVTFLNKKYLQILDALNSMNKVPIDAPYPYLIIAKFINDNHLQYEKLLAYADRWYNKETILQLAHTAQCTNLENEE